MCKSVRAKEEPFELHSITNPLLWLVLVTVRQFLSLGLLLVFNNRA